MATKYPSGSAGDKEQKEFKRYILPFFALAAVLSLLICFVFKTEVNVNVKAAPVLWNIVGAILILASPYIVFRAYKAGEEGSMGWSILAFVVLAAGIFTAAGFYGYTY